MVKGKEGGLNELSLCIFLCAGVDFRTVQIKLLEKSIGVRVGVEDE